MNKISDLLGKSDLEALSEEELLDLRIKFDNEVEGKLNEEDGVNCDKCKNRGFITIKKFYDIYNRNDKAVRMCLCNKKRNMIRIAINSGLGEYLKKDFNNFETVDEWQKNCKNKALNYLSSEKEWFMMCGQSGCVDCDTEFFNGVEWKKISEYEPIDKVLQFDEKRKASLVYPVRYIKNKSEELYHLENETGSINQTLSLEHNFLYEVKGKLYKKKFKDVIKKHNESIQGFCGKVLTTFNYSGKGINLNDNEIRIMCAFICDGTFANVNQGAIRVKKERKINRLRELLKDVSHHEYIEKDGYSRFVFYPPVREKEFNNWWYECTNEQLAIVCDEVIKWDGSINHGRKTFSTTIKKNADFIQFAYSSQGYRTTINCCDRAGEKRKEYIRKSKEYILCISKSTKLALARTGGIKKPKVEKVNTKDGYEYCFEVPSGMLVLRRNDRIFITGNCGKTLLCSIVANNFLNQDKIVQYITWTDFISKVKRDMMGDNTNQVSEYLEGIKNVEILFIDELLKKYNETDLKYIIEIINYRYTNNLKTIVTSEREIQDLLDIDEATFGRVIEKCGNYIISIPKDRKKNYRLKNIF